jgi:hypothetical protein
MCAEHYRQKDAQTRRAVESWLCDLLYEGLRQAPDLAAQTQLTRDNVPQFAAQIADLIS